VSPLRVVHYLNQFFAGVGGEEQAGVAPDSREGAVGPGMALQAALGEEASIAGTVWCGDSRFAEDTDEALEAVLELIRSFEPDVVVAGPAFSSGRYGLACAHVCTAVQERLGLPAVTGLHESSPGAVPPFRHELTIVATRQTAAGMRDAAQAMARVALKLARGEPLAPAAEEGTLPRGFRLNEFADRPGAARAVDMLLAKVRGEPFATEWPLPDYDRVEPAAPVSAERPRLALVAEGGVVPRGNPDRLPGGWARTWGRYELEGVEDLDAEAFEVVHGGFDTGAGNRDPDRLAPVDAARSLEREGVLTLHPYLYSTVGNMGSLEDMRRVGAEIGRALDEAGVHAAVVGST
jgi:glycine reductase complex component B subunit gamma